MLAALSLTGWDWVVLAVAAVLVGFAKTAIGGAGSVAVALFAAVLPARESTGALLPLLLVGDLLAVGTYRRHADWRVLARLFPSVAAGILLGAGFVARVDDTVMRRTIGGLLLGLVAVHLWLRGRHRGQQRGQQVVPPGAGRRHAIAFGFGLLAGFTTMVANAGGPVMSLYLLSAGISMLGFLGTNAWFFLVVNAFKVPFSVGLGLITSGSLVLTAACAPAVLAGAVIGRSAVHRLDQSRFEQLVLLFTVVSSVNLLR